MRWWWEKGELKKKDLHETLRLKFDVKDPKSIENEFLGFAKGKLYGMAKDTNKTIRLADGTIIYIKANEWNPKIFIEKQGVIGKVTKYLKSAKHIKTKQLCPVFVIYNPETAINFYPDWKTNHIGYLVNLDRLETGTGVWIERNVEKEEEKGYFTSGFFQEKQDYFNIPTPDYEGEKIESGYKVTELEKWGIDEWMDDMGSTNAIYLVTTNPYSDSHLVATGDLEHYSPGPKPDPPSQTALWSSWGEGDPPVLVYYPVQGPAFSFRGTPPYSYLGAPDCQWVSPHYVYNDLVYKIGHGMTVTPEYEGIPNEPILKETMESSRQDTIYFQGGGVIDPNPYYRTIGSKVGQKIHYWNYVHQYSYPEMRSMRITEEDTRYAYLYGVSDPGDYNWYSEGLAHGWADLLYWGPAEETYGESSPELYSYKICCSGVEFELYRGGYGTFAPFDLEIYKYPRGSENPEPVYVYTYGIRESEDSNTFIRIGYGMVYREENYQIEFDTSGSGNESVKNQFSDFNKGIGWVSIRAAEIERYQYKTWVEVDNT